MQFTCAQNAYTSFIICIFIILFNPGTFQKKDILLFYYWISRLFSRKLATLYNSIISPHHNRKNYEKILKKIIEIVIHILDTQNLHIYYPNDNNCALVSLM